MLFVDNFWGHLGSLVESTSFHLLFTLPLHCIVHAVSSLVNSTVDKHICRPQNLHILLLLPFILFYYYYFLSYLPILLPPTFLSPLILNLTHLSLSLSLSIFGISPSRQPISHPHFSPLYLLPSSSSLLLLPFSISSSSFSFEFHLDS